MHKRFVNKTVVVTGASSGIDTAVVKRFVEEGARIVMAARRGDVVQEIADTITY